MDKRISSTDDIMNLNLPTRSNIPTTTEYPDNNVPARYYSPFRLMDLAQQICSGGRRSTPWNIPMEYSEPTPYSMDLAKALGERLCGLVNGPSAPEVDIPYGRCREYHLFYHDQPIFKDEPAEKEEEKIPDEVAAEDEKEAVIDEDEEAVIDEDEEEIIVFKADQRMHDQLMKRKNYKSKKISYNSSRKITSRREGRMYIYHARN
ncbi:hypothetical protein ACP275_08G230600 [Erythranthe tilingii]